MTITGECEVCGNSNEKTLLDHKGLTPEEAESLLIEATGLCWECETNDRN